MTVASRHITGNYVTRVVDASCASRRVCKAHSELAPYRLPHLLVAATVVHGPLDRWFPAPVGSTPARGSSLVVKWLFDAVCGTARDR